MLRFGIYVLQDAPWPEIARRARAAEESGLDTIWVADHSRDFRDPTGVWLDGWATLAALATQTSHVRVGTLVANPILRPPSTLALQALTLDHLSAGRFDLGIGTGIARFDHAATGTPYWSAGERAARFAEYLRVVDGLLRSAEQPFELEGRFYGTSGLSMHPPPTQRPRPPITVGGQSPTVRRLAAEIAECWNTHGPFGASIDEILEITTRQNAELDELCSAAGRDPRTLRRSLLCFGALDPWTSGGPIDDLVSRFREVGITEFVFFWPPDGRLEPLERVMRAA